jgi:hypothetical protein
MVKLYYDIPIEKIELNSIVAFGTQSLTLDFNISRYLV